MEQSKVQFSKERPEQSLGFMFWQATNLWQRAMTRALNELGLTHVQFVLLAGVGWLTRSHDQVTQIMLSQHAKTDIMMTSKVVRVLEKKNLIVRKSHTRDTRAKSLTLSDLGRSTLIKALDIVEKIDQSFFEQLTQSEKRNFIETLKKVVSL